MCFDLVSGNKDLRQGKTEAIAFSFFIFQSSHARRSNRRWTKGSSKTVAVLLGAGLGQKRIELEPY